MDPNGSVTGGIDRLPLQAHAELAHDALRGVVADLGDADDPLQAAIDQAEAKSRPCGLGGEPLPPEWTSEPPADLHRGHHLGEELRYRQSSEADQLPSGAQIQGEQPEAVTVLLALARPDARLGLPLIAYGSVAYYPPPYLGPRTR
jgi:hypothetical protein